MAAATERHFGGMSGTLRWARLMFAPHLAWRQRRALREKFRDGRTARPQTDADFVRAVFPAPTAAEEAAAVAIRRLVADACGIQPELLHSDDRTVELEELVGQTHISHFLLAIPDGLDFLEFCFRLEKVLSNSCGVRKIAPSVRDAAHRFWTTGEYDFGRWTGWLVREVLGQQPRKTQ